MEQGRATYLFHTLVLPSNTYWAMIHVLSFPPNVLDPVNLSKGINYNPTRVWGKFHLSHVQQVLPNNCAKITRPVQPCYQLAPACAVKSCRYSKIQHLLPRLLPSLCEVVWERANQFIQICLCLFWDYFLSHSVISRIILCWYLPSF